MCYDLKVERRPDQGKGVYQEQVVMLSDWAESLARRGRFAPLMRW